MCMLPHRNKKEKNVDEKKDKKNKKEKKDRKKKEHNVAYIDAQNLFLWVRADWRGLNYPRFRRFLKDKFSVQEAYYFLWYLDPKEQDLYTRLQKAWFILVFREHSPQMKWRKKWNVDVDMCFSMMRSLCDEEEFDSIVVVSWDGDYIKPVKYFIEQWRFKKIIFPNRNHSSLYKQLSNKNYYYLWNAKHYISYDKK